MKHPEEKFSFREIEHTADIGIIVEAESLSGLFAGAAYGMIHLLFGEKTAKSRGIRKINLAEATHEELLISWLSELNYYITVQGFAPAEILHLEITGHDRNYQLTGEVTGGNLHDPETEIKAITYHQFYLKKTGNDRFEAKIIFDI